MMGDRARPLRPGLSGTLLFIEVCVLLVCEVRRPLRPRRDDKLPRNARNGAIAMLSVVATATLESPLSSSLARLVGRRGWGLVPRLPLPRAARAIVAIGLMDYTMYLWHTLAHRTPLLWRFHQVHHVDRGLDASTALRFHAGELVLSVPWRLIQILVIGTTPLQLTLWQTLFLSSVLFHHSDVRLPAGLERRLRRVVITPPLHGIHHADRRELEMANFSSGLTLWDRLHGTYIDAPEDDIAVGLPAFTAAVDQSFIRMLALPFVEQVDAFVTTRPASLD